MQGMPRNYLIDKVWMDSWLKFVKEQGEIPGEIDNRAIFSLIQ